MHSVTSERRWGGVLSSVLLLVVAALTVRWWWTAFATLLADLRVAGEVGGQEEATPARSPGLPEAVRGALLAREHTPLQRQLAFRGVARRVAARRRWEGGFGRRGL